jgi:hypothetical protein
MKNYSKQKRKNHGYQPIKYLHKILTPNDSLQDVYMKVKF